MPAPEEPPQTACVAALPPPVSLSAALLNRDHSILAFNERVFDWAVRADVPLLERLRYLCIVSSNLDEFFEVRTAPYVAAARDKDTK
ncbi:MAG: polyphosphate kinase 1, partial [Giesbergeria sp.]|nr:polyphosphate kinase 1 [Giesbergeria sp.]